MLQSPLKQILLLLIFVSTALLGLTQQPKIYAAIEISIYPARINADFSKKHPVKFFLVAKNNLNTAQKGIIDYMIRNLFDDIVETGKMEVLVNAGKKFKEGFLINFDKQGIYRIEFDINFPRFSEKQIGKFTYQ
ncbi:MAG: hypothetical protein K2X37_09110 [Chitinophagaceae bacterium]|nr:hypothetical protein [Chitinophagaceae bacterium]